MKSEATSGILLVIVVGDMLLSLRSSLRLTSPSIAETTEDFPLPTLPTMARTSPLRTSTASSRSMDTWDSSFSPPQVQSPESCMRGVEESSLGGGFGFLPRGLSCDEWKVVRDVRRRYNTFAVASLQPSLLVQSHLLR